MRFSGPAVGGGGEEAAGGVEQDAADGRIGSGAAGIDGRFVERDYFIAENDRSQWVWIFRTRGGAADLQAPTSPRWFLQGIFG